MNSQEIKNIQDKFNSGEELLDLEQAYISGLLGSTLSLAEANENPTEFFLEDILGRKCNFDFKSIFSPDEIVIFENEIKECFNSGLSLSGLSPDRSLRTWLEPALKALDVIAIHYIRDFKNVDFERAGMGDERAKYAQIKGFSERGTEHNIGRIGMELFDIHGEMKHYMKTKDDGSHKIISINYKRCKRNLVKHFKKIIESFEELYINKYNQANGANV